MGFMDWVSQQKDKLATEVSKFRNRDFLEAVVAGCAMVAYADGVVSPEEKAKMTRFIQQSDALKNFDLTEVITIFNNFVTKFDFDVQIGRAEALKVIGKLRKKPDDARMMVRVCCAIGAADGSFDKHEQSVVRDICTELTLNPADFGL